MVQCDFRKLPDGRCRCEHCGFVTEPTKHEPNKIRRPCSPTKNPTVPPMLTRAANYAKAVTRWTAAGKPERTDAEVDHLFREFCQPCEMLVDGKCTGCGCPVKPSKDESTKGVISKALLNKLRMGTERCPLGKWGQQPASDPDRPFSRKDYQPETAKRNLIFFLCPLEGAQAWQRHLGILKQSLDTFNGMRIAGLAYGPGIADPAPTVRALSELGFHVQLFKNDPALREVVGWIPSLELLKEHAEPNSVTFACHGKGVQRDSGTTCHRWTDLMYDSLLGYMTLVDRLLKAYPIVGSFKKTGKAFAAKSKSDWHYSGTFYWFSNRAVFDSPRWRDVDSEWWGTESWPGKVFAARDAGCVFHEAEFQKMDLYKPDVFSDVEREYENWQQEHKPLRTADPLGEFSAKAMGLYAAPRI